MKLTRDIIFSIANHIRYFIIVHLYISVDTLNKKQAISLIQKSNISSISVEYNHNHFKINIEGEIMEKQVNQISLKSLYDLMVTKFDSIEIDIKEMKTEIKDIKFDIHNIKEELISVNARLDIIEKLPTIVNELKYIVNNKELIHKKLFISIYSIIKWIE